jgi:hypothetical protein
MKGPVGSLSNGGYGKVSWGEIGDRLTHHGFDLFGRRFVVDPHSQYMSSEGLD